ncbi:MAG: hypothetical protein AABW68_05155 [archaeon]
MRDSSCLPLDLIHLLGKKDFVPILDAFYFSRFPGFNALTRELGVTPRQLSIRLKEMESSLLLEKKGDSYRITPKGRELGDIVQSLKGMHSCYHEGYDSCAGTPCGVCRSQPNSRANVSLILPPATNRE